MDTKRQSLKDVKRDAEALTRKRLADDNFEPRYPNGYRNDTAEESTPDNSKAATEQPKHDESRSPEHNALGESLMPKEDSASKGTKTPQAAKEEQDRVNAQTAKKEAK